MNNKVFYLSFSIIAVVLIAFDVCMVFENISMKKRINLISEKQTTELTHIKESISELSTAIRNQNSNVNENLVLLSGSVNQLRENQTTELTKLQENVSLVKENSAAQFASTQNMEHTYSTLLIQQQKKTVQDAVDSTNIEDCRNDAYRYYSIKDYKNAYAEFNKVLQNLPDDFKSRMMKVKSLYYANPADSSKYTEILNDISLLRLNCFIDDELTEIEKNIEFEKGNLDE